MRVRLYLLRHLGRRLPWLEVDNSTPLAGSIQLYRVHHRAYGDVLTLRLFDPGNQTKEGTLATLYEPVLSNLGNGMMVFRGIERIDSREGPVGYAQEWRCEIRG